MGHQYGRSGEPAQVVPQPGADRQAGTGIQRRERLVEQQEPRLYGQRPGQRHPLGLPAGQGRRLGERVPGQVHARQPFERGTVCLGTAQSLAPQPEGHIVHCGQMRKEQIVLEHQADPAPFHRYAVQVHAVQAYLTGRRDQTGEYPQDRRLPRTVRTEQRDHLAAGHLELRVQPEAVALQADAGHEAHPSHRSRNVTRIATETASSTRLSTIAASGSDSRAR